MWADYKSARAGVLFEIYRKEQEDRVASEEEIEELQNKIH